MKADIIAEYERARGISWQKFRSACYAPYTSLYFETRGNVRACCHNHAYPVGNISSSSLDDIWHGDAIQRLRDAVLQYDFSCGCEFCEWQLSTRTYKKIATRKFDRLVPDSLEPSWPKMMEFSISNTCNLECVMCDGNHSSAIRANREARAPLLNPYTDAFFTQLREYLPHLERARFLGGEPFLQEECYRIWNMIVEDKLGLQCHVATNATVIGSRAESILAALPCSIAVSLDGYKKETIESIRVNARYEKLMDNIYRLWAYTRSKRTYFEFSFCIMRQNWDELGDVCLFADSLDCHVGVNLVRRPAEMSLFALSKEEIGDVVRRMEKQAVELLPKLKRNRDVWLRELSRLRYHTLGPVEVPGLVSIRGAKLRA